MIRRNTLWLMVGILVIVGLLAGPLASAAQEPLTEVFTWSAYGLLIEYPAGWTVTERGDAVSVFPAGRDVSAGQGPELVLFVVGAGDLGALIADYAASIAGTTGVIVGGTLDGRATRAFEYDQAMPDTLGRLKLIALEGGVVIGVAYTVRDSEAAAFEATLRAIYHSASFGVPAEPGAPGAESVTPARLGPNPASYQDAAYRYRLSYPADWTLTQTGRPGEIALTPPGTFAGGPELSVVVVEGMAGSDLPGLMDSMIAGRPGTFNVAPPGTLGGFEMLSMTYTGDGGHDGAGILVRLSDDTVLAFGYHALSAEYARYEPVFAAITDSLAVRAVPVVESLPGTTVQLPQRYQWLEGGLAVYLPEGWTVEQTVDDVGGQVLIATPGTSYRGPARWMQAWTLPWATSQDLRSVAEEVAGNFGQVTSAFIEAGAPGYEGVTFEALDTSRAVPMYAQVMVLAASAGDEVVMVVTTAEQPDWTDFRPVVGAFFASLEPLHDAVSSRSLGQVFRHDAPGAPGALASLVRPVPPALPRQDGDDPPFFWEEMGLTIGLPEGWQTTFNGQNFDVALVSPEAFESGQGAFVTIRDVPTLGSDGDPVAALEPIAEQIGSDAPEAYTSESGLPGAVLVHYDEEAGTWHRFVLLTYDGDIGSSLYVQSTAVSEEQDAMIAGLIDGVTLDVPKSDYAAIDAAWQASLAESGRLIYGPDDAPITMVEFLSMTCGHCANYSVSMDRLIALDVEETGRVQFELALLTGDPYSELATKAIYCAAEQGAGYSAYKALFEGYFIQGYEYAYSEEGALDILGGLDLDTEALSTCIADDTYADARDAIRVRFTDHGLTGTPTVVLAAGEDEPQPLTLPDGRVWSGTIPVNVLREMIDLALEEGVPFEEYFNR